MIDLNRVVRWYYLATPLFLLADLLFRAPVRVSFINSPSLRLLYYVFCFGCGIAMWKRPMWTRTVAMSETLLNFVLVIFSIMLPIYGTMDALLANAALPEMRVSHVINAGMSGAFLLLNFYGALHPARRARADGIV